MGHIFDDPHKTHVKHWPWPRGCSGKDQKRDQNLADLGNSHSTANEQKEGKKFLEVQFVSEDPGLPPFRGCEKVLGQAAA